MPTTEDHAASSDSQRKAVNEFNAAIEEFFSKSGLYFTDMRKTSQILERIAELAESERIVNQLKADELRAFSEHYKKIGAFELELPAEGESKVEKLCEQSQRIIDDSVLKESELAIVISQATNNRLSALLNEVAKKSESNPELRMYLIGDASAPPGSYERSTTQAHTDRVFQMTMRRSMLVGAVIKHARESRCVSRDEMEKLKRITEGFTSTAADFNNKITAAEEHFEDLLAQLFAVKQLVLENSKSSPDFNYGKLKTALSEKFPHGTKKKKSSPIRDLFTKTSWKAFMCADPETRTRQLSYVSETIHGQFNVRATEWPHPYVSGASSGALLKSYASVSSSSEQTDISSVSYSSEQTDISSLQDTDLSDDEYEPNHRSIDKECSVTPGSGQALKGTMYAESSPGFFSGDENELEQPPVELHSVVKILEDENLLNKEQLSVLGRTPYTTWCELIKALREMNCLNPENVRIVMDSVNNMLAQGETAEKIKETIVSAAWIFGSYANNGLCLSHEEIKKIMTECTYSKADIFDRLATSELLTEHNFQIVFRMTEASLKSLDSKFPLNQKLVQKDFDAAIKAVAREEKAQGVNDSLEASRKTFRK